jgi:hypothetical protein
MTYRLAFNPTDSPVIIDDDGRGLAGHDWAAVDDSSALVTDAIAAGRLVWPAIPDGLAGDGTRAGTVQQQVEQINSDAPKKATVKVKENG